VVVLLFCVWFCLLLCHGGAALAFGGSGWT
jgi:fumarate reductase subunit C